MKKIRFSAFAILLVMTVTLLAACSTKDPGTDQTMNPSSTQSTSGTNQGSMNESATNGQRTDETSTGSRNGADEESSTGVIGGMIDDVEDGVDDMLDGGDGATRGNENK